MQKSKPQRMCIGCRNMKEKDRLIRIVRLTDDTFHLDPTGRMNGKGAYLCKDPVCLQQAIKSKALNRSFRQAVPEVVYEQLTKEMYTISG